VTERADIVPVVVLSFDGMLFFNRRLCLSPVVGCHKADRAQCDPCM